MQLSNQFLFMSILLVLVFSFSCQVKVEDELQTNSKQFNDMKPDSASTAIKSIPTSVAETNTPPDVLFNYTYGIRLLNSAQHKEAIAQFDIVIRVLPNLAIAYENRGIAYYHEEQYEVAMNDLNKAIELDDKRESAYSHRGIVQYEKGLYDAALSDFDQAIALNPEYVPAYNNRGRLLITVGLKEKGMIDLEKAIKLYEQANDNKNIADIRQLIEMYSKTTKNAFWIKVEADLDN